MLHIPLHYNTILMDAMQCAHAVDKLAVNISGVESRDKGS